MKALVISEYAHPSKLQLTQNAPEPVPATGSDELLIDVYSAGLNFFDFAGIVVTAPPGCPHKPGDRRVVAKMGNGAGGISITIRRATKPFGRGKLQAGEWLLVLAAAGGVGIAAIQIGKALGAHVIACASPSKLDVAREIDHWGRGVDLVYDPVGRIKDALKCITWSGRALVVGFAGGEIEKLPLNLVLLKNVSIIGIFWGSYAQKDPQHVRETWTELLELFASGRLKPVVYSGKYTLETVVEGLQDLENRKTWGKAVARVREQRAIKGKL
ncbi:hypothetical protein EI94DRAFT_1727604 [Lactarius quietus]|nr:hypothetical protein EI94DRAFT_1727604 [Lactarius quietus]